MSDRRSRREKLRAMAEQSVSPHEAEIARRKLQAMDDTHRTTAGADLSDTHDATFMFTFTSANFARFDEVARRWSNHLTSYSQAQAAFDAASDFVRGEGINRRHGETGRGWSEWEDA